MVCTSYILILDTCKWHTWEPWSPCTKMCDTNVMGIRQRIRTKLSKENDEGKCTEPFDEKQSCISKLPCLGIQKDLHLLKYWYSYTMQVPKVSKTVRYLSEISQKTVSYKNVSENSLNYVRILSENCQIQICVRTLSEKISDQILSLQKGAKSSLKHTTNINKS